MKRSFRVLCLALLLAACSDRETPGAQTSPSPSSGTPGVVALNSSELVGDQTVFNTVRFVRLDGKEIHRFKLPKGATPPTVGGDRVFFVVEGEVRSVDASGASVNHGKFMDKEPAFTKLIVSPDGKRWAWSVEERHGDDSITTKIFIAGTNSEKPRVLIEETKDQTIPIPVLWSSAGLVIVDMPDGIGGLVFFADSYWGQSRLIDPDSGKSTPLTGSADKCPLSDVSSDGSWTCIKGLGRGGGSVATPTRGSVVLHRPGATPLEFPIDQPALQTGSALISPRDDLVAVGIYSGQRSDKSYSLSTILFDISSRTQSIAATDDTVPIAWLPGGGLILEGADFTHPKGCSLLLSDGSRVNFGEGRFIGFLDAAGSVARR